MSDSSNALVLPAERVSTSEAQTFPGFPGVYRPGVPVLLATIDLDVMAARARIEELGLPLVETTHDGPEEAPVPDRAHLRLEGNQPFDDGLAPAEAPSEAPANDETALEKLTKAELVEHAALLDPPLVLDESAKKDDLLAAIHEHLLPPQTTPPPEPPHDETPGGDA